MAERIEQDNAVLLPFILEISGEAAWDFSLCQFRSNGASILKALEVEGRPQETPRQQHSETNECQVILDINNSSYTFFI